MFLDSQIDKLINSVKKDSSAINDTIVKTCLNSLSGLKDPKSVPILIEILKGNDKLYSALAGEALGEIGDRENLSAIEEILNNTTDPLQLKLLEKAYEKLSEN